MNSLLKIVIRHFVFLSGFPLLHHTTTTHYCNTLFIVHLGTTKLNKDGFFENHDTARSRKDETRNGHWNGNQNPGWSKFRFLFEKRPVTTIEDSDVHSDDHYKSHLSGNGLYDTLCFFLFMYCCNKRMQHTIATH